MDLHRVGAILGGLVALNWAFLLYGTNDAYPFAVWFEIALAAIGLSMAISGCLLDSKHLKSSTLASLLAVFVGFLLWSWVQVHLQPSYGTDEIAFNEYAARLLQHGLNPYTHSMQPAFDLFRVSPNGFTLRLDGTPVETFSYPSLSFLPYVPLLMAGMTSQVAIFVNVLLWVLVGIELYVLMPEKTRIFIAPVFSIAAYTGFAVGGVTDPLYLVFLLPSVKYLYLFNTSQKWTRWIAPVGLGLAIAVKQTPWVIAPFLLFALFLDARSGEDNAFARRQSIRFVSFTVLVAVIPNLPFMAWDLKAWLEGVLTPIQGGLVPAGQGLIALSTFLGIGGGDLGLVTAGMVLLFVLLLLLHLVFSAQLGRAFLIFPSLILFMASRSFATYLIMLIPVMLVATGTSGRVSNFSPSIQVKLRNASWLVTAMFFLLVTKSLLTQPPLKVNIEAIHTTGQLATVSEIQIRVTNRTNKAISPQYAVQAGGALTVPWNIRIGQKSISPGSTNTVVLTSPNFPAQPRLTGGFQIAALTTTPAALSISSPYRPTNWHIGITPQAVNRPVQIGVPVVLTCQLLDEMNRPVHMAGVQMFLGQVTYAQSGIVFSQAVINQAGIGQTPVAVGTNRLGSARFFVRGTEVTRDPVYFEANLVNSEAHFPYGYSEIIPIRFKANQ